jgi:hypothetical protein
LSVKRTKAMEDALKKNTFQGKVSTGKIVVIQLIAGAASTKTYFRASFL